MTPVEKIYSEESTLLTQVFDISVNLQKDYKSIPGEDIKRDCLGSIRNTKT